MGRNQKVRDIIAAKATVAQRRVANSCGRSVAGRRILTEQERKEIFRIAKEVKEESRR